MNFDGKVTFFNPSNHSYLINFKLYSDNINIPEGYAYITLKIGDTQVNIHNECKELDDEIYRFLKVKFLKTIYNYNSTRIAKPSVIFPNLHK